MKPLNLASPHLIIMVGIPGSGKTFFAEHFASTFSAPYVSAQQIASLSGGNSTDESSSRLTKHLLEQLFKTGQTIIYEGASDTRSHRLELAKAARTHGYNPLLVWVQTESISAKQRATKAQKGTSALSSDQFDAALKRFTPPNVSEKAIVISGKHTYASQLKIVLKRLAEGRSAEAVPERPTSGGRHIVVR
jgi:predicted kinase